MPKLSSAVALRALALLACSSPLGAQTSPAPSFRLDEILVTGTPVPTPLGALGNHATVLRGDDLRARGITRVVDALREMAGITIARNGSHGAVASLFLRGAESDHTLVLIDGVQVNQPGGGFDFSGLTTESIERIEVVRGPSSALYGSDAVSGVIHIITRGGTGLPTASLATTAGSFGTRDGVLSVSGGGRDAGYALDLARYHTDGILPFNNAHRNTVLNGRVELALDGRTGIRLSTRGSDRSYGFPTDFSGNVVDTNQRTFHSETLVGIELDRRIGDALLLRALLSVHQARSGTDDAPDSPADTLGSYGFQSLDALSRRQADLRATWTLSPATSVTGGIEFEEQEVRTFNESLSQWGPSSGRSGNRRSNEAGYLHLVAGSGSLAGSGGIRMESNAQFGSFLTGQIGGSWRIGPATRLRISAGRGIKEPTFFEAFATGFVRGNPELEPERSTSIDLGAEHAFLGGALEVDATLFRQRFDNLIQYTGLPPAPGAPNYFNVAAAASTGVELGVRAKLPLGFDLRLQTARVETEVLDAGFDDGPSATFVEGAPLLRRPRTQIHGSVGWRGRPGWRVDLSALRIGERADRDFTVWPARAVVLPAHTRLDASIEGTLLAPTSGRPGFSLLLRGENLLDTDYSDVYGFPAPGRALHVGGRLFLGR